MSRSNYSEDCEYLDLWRANVQRTIKGKRGQRFLRELSQTLDAMPEKVLIRSELVSAEGQVCTIGAVCKAKGIDVSEVDTYDPEAVGNLVGISPMLAAEIEFQNDEGVYYDETPAKRWLRMRAWVAENLDEKVT